MTVTRKVGSLLLAFTIASLIGTLTFGVFYAGSAYDALFWISSNFGGSLLQQLQNQTLRIREGDSGARASAQQVYTELDGLMAALETGGRATERVTTGTSVEMLRRIAHTASGAALPQDGTSTAVVNLLIDTLPTPPAQLRPVAHELHQEWNDLREPLQLIMTLPPNDPAAKEAYAKYQANYEKVDETSRQLSVAASTRILQRRTTMLMVLAGVSASSIAMLIIGLLIARRYIAGPIDRLQKAIGRIRAGDPDYRAKIESNDETAQLARHFNELLDEMQRSAARYRMLFENATDFVYVTDLDGNFQATNRAGELMLGYGPGELNGKCIDEIVVPEQNELPGAMRQAKISGEHPITVYELDVRTKDGRRLTLENSSGIIIESGKPIAIQGICRDVTERKRMQHQLRTSQKMEAIGRFAGGIAHDFGNVLTIINGYCALIRTRMSQTDPLRTEIEGIQKAGERAASMIRHLLGFSRGQIFRPRLLKLGPSLVELSVVLRRLIGEDITIKVDVAPDLGMVRFDPAQLEQVVINLSLNARDSMKSGGILEITAHNFEVSSSHHGNGRAAELRPGSYVKLSVRDSGHGMPPEVLAQIFEPFFSTKEHGTGLGLSTVQGIVRQSGGSIHADSTLNEGTTITVCLPRFDEIQETSEPPILLRKTGTETILVVEDEDDVRRLVRDMLSLGGYQVLEAANGYRASELSSYMQNRIDLMLTDVVMPNMSGPEVVEAVRGKRPGLKVVYMSGYPQDKFEDSNFSVQRIHFLQKPLSSDTLLTTIRKVLDGTEIG